MRQHLRCLFAWEGLGETIPLQAVEGYLIDWPQGADAISMSFTEARTPDGIGSTAWETLIPARPITITGYILGLPLDVMTRRLLRAFAAGSTGRLISTDRAKRSWSLECKVMQSPMVEGVPSLPRFQLQVRADYPYWEREEETTASIPVGSWQEVNVGGDVPAVYQIKISIASGNADGIRIADLGTGAVMDYEGTVESGQELTLSVSRSGRVACTLDGASVINAVSGGLRKLPPGRREIKIICAPGVTGTAEIRYREAVSGV